MKQVLQMYQLIFQVEFFISQPRLISKVDFLDWFSTKVIFFRNQPFTRTLFFYVSKLPYVNARMTEPIGT